MNIYLKLGRFLPTSISKIIKVLQYLLLLMTFTFLGMIFNQYYTYTLVTTHQKHPCSFDNISACQISNITSRTFLYISWSRAGFCSEINQILLAFAYSVSTKRHFVIDCRQWNYGKFTDYFTLPSTNYYFQSNRIFLVRNNDENERIDHLKTTRIGTQLHQFWIATQSVQSIQLKRLVAHYLWKSISNETLKFIQTRRITNLSNYIGIHIRKGDKIGREAPAIQLNKYIQSIEQILHSNKNLQHIFVASDDRTVIKKLRQLKFSWHFVSIHENIHQKMNITGHFQEHFNRLTEKEKLFETRLLMCELQMLIDSEYVICGMSSNVCRLVQILRHQNPSTMISLDRSWRAT